MANPIDEAVDQLIAREILGQGDKVMRAYKITGARRQATAGMEDVIDLKDSREDRWMVQVERMKKNNLTEADQTWKDAAARHERTINNLSDHEESFKLKKI